MLKPVVIALVLMLPLCAHSQEITQTIRGTVVDRESNSPLPGANIVVITCDPMRGASSDLKGRFRIERVPVGRQTIQASYLGYETFTYRDILVGSGKEVILNFELAESALEMESVEITATADNKDQPINSMASVSARQLSVEEASRYAGGFDDPSRLASSFAGVAGSLQNNGIVIRGNAPKGLQWRMEGIEISNPSHYADIVVLGGGGITALSSHMLSNSDFITSAFPAEYGNALSGVFDIRLRSGNNEKYERTFQLGALGTDLSAEGPFMKGHPSSFLFNYRYSTLALFAPLLPEDAGGIRYQDLSFKLNFPTDIGQLSLWGLGAIDHGSQTAERDTNDWKYNQDREQAVNDQRMGAVGVAYHVVLGQSTHFHAGSAASGNAIFWKMKRLDELLAFHPRESIRHNTWKYTFSSFINHKFSARHTSKTGMVIDRLNYDIRLRHALATSSPLETTVDERDGSYLIRAYSQSRLELSPRLGLTLGLHHQYFTLNGRRTWEPRLGLRVALTPRQTWTIGYGLHSQLEMIGIYLARQTTSSGIVQPNKHLDFSKSHHVVAGYEHRLADDARLNIEAYYQHLFDIPVIKDSSFSILNIQREWFMNEPLVNKGRGHNVGLDVTLERFLRDGVYWMLTGSIFDSKYTGGDGVERNTRFNRRFVVNALAGKEWTFGGNTRTRILGVNGKITWMGGERLTPVFYDPVTEEVKDDGTRAFETRKPTVYYADVTVSYKVIKPGLTHNWSLQLINALGRKESYGYRYNLRSGTIDKEEELLMIPNISYKIEF